MDGRGAVDRSLDELREIVAPIAASYGVPKAYLFGSNFMVVEKDTFGIEDAITVDELIETLRKL